MTNDMPQHADKKLAARLLKGDRASFDLFFNNYFPRIYRFALVRLGYDHDLAEETAQTVLCQALSKMSTFRGEAPLFSWLCTFTRYEISRQVKARGRAQGDTELREEDPSVRAALESLLCTTRNDPDVAAYQQELSRLVLVTLDYLPSLYADALERKYVHGDSVRAIASRIGKSEKATESILTRARAAFREAFESLVAEEHKLGGGKDKLASVFE
ncbi:MAG: RNA polymerase sigma factor [Gammaproteobacteria bacterium]|nr:RNA polymerase sigma factor [Gammaproteobacteria bacterium]